MSILPAYPKGVAPYRAASNMLFDCISGVRGQYCGDHLVVRTMRSTTEILESVHTWKVLA